MPERVRLLEQQLLASERRAARLRDAVMFARYEIDNARRSALAADDHLRRAMSDPLIDSDEPLDWIC